MHKGFCYESGAFWNVDCKYIRVVHAKEAECSTELSSVIKRLDLSLHQAYHNYFHCQHCKIKIITQ